MAEPRLLCRTELEVIVDEDRLAVETKRRFVGLTLEPIEDAVNQPDEPEPLPLVREMRLAFPAAVSE